ncbi:MAG: FAD-dependent oxidoreductase [Vampirovibrionales bacterium]
MATPDVAPTQESQTQWDVIIVGAGVAGLQAAQVAEAKGQNVLVIDSSERIGGRVATDWVDGFALDRGFQVVLTAYPELKKAINMNELGLKSFVSGAWVFTGHQQFVPLYDPLRHPIKALLALGKSLTAPFLTLGDIVQVLRLRWDILAQSEAACWQDDGLSTLAYLRQRGFSEKFIDAFWTPFLRGIFLEAELATPAKLFRFIFKMFATGTAALPAEGMEALPKTMAKNLSHTEFCLNMGVQSATRNSVLLESGQTLTANKVIWAAPNAPIGSAKQEWRATTCVYYMAPVAPIAEKVLLVNGTGEGLINTVCVPTMIQPAYRKETTEGHLVSVSLLGTHPNPRPKVEAELAKWFGADALASWQWIKTNVIPQALPVWHGETPPQDEDHKGIWHCGDTTTYPSLNGALASGRDPVSSC